MNKIICLFKGHCKIYWSNQDVIDHNVLGGVFTPFYCKRCGCHSQLFFSPYNKEK